MRLISAAAAAALVLVLTSPAQALTRKQLDCPAKAVKPDIAKARPTPANQDRSAIDQQSVNQIGMDERRCRPRTAFDQGVMRRMTGQCFGLLKALPSLGYSNGL